MPRNRPPNRPPRSPRSARWQYWLLIPLCSLGYTVFCFAFVMAAWGFRGAPKPWWYEVFAVLTAPGVWSSSSLPIIGSAYYLGPPLWGGIIGFGLVLLIRCIRSLRHNR